MLHVHSAYEQELVLTIDRMISPAEWGLAGLLEVLSRIKDNNVLITCAMGSHFVVPGTPFFNPFHGASSRFGKPVPARHSRRPMTLKLST